MDFINNFFYYNLKKKININKKMSLEELSCLTNAFNILCIDSAIRPAMYYVANQKITDYQLAVNTYLINKYCENCIVIGDLVINKNYIHLLKNEPTNEIDNRVWEGKLLGYVSPGELNENVRIQIQLNIPSGDKVRLWSYEAKKITSNQKRQIEKQISNIKKLLKNKMLTQYSIYLNENVITEHTRSY